MFEIGQRTNHHASALGDGYQVCMISR